MIAEILREGRFAKLFAAQIVALLGTGLLTVALGLLAFDLTGGDAALILGTALAIKMVAYVAGAPLVAALTARVPRKTLLVSADCSRAAVACLLPAVTEVWQIYVLILFLQLASATFTPAYQAIIPQILPNEKHYTQALSLSRLAYDLESIASPAIAALLLTATSHSSLFIGTVVGFVASAGLVATTSIPAISTPTMQFVERLTGGARIMWRTPQLRALLTLNLVVAAGTSLVVVTTVVLVQGVLARPPEDVALLFAAYGIGSAAVALSAPRIVRAASDRTVFLAGGVAVPMTLVAIATVSAVAPTSWLAFLMLWLALGAATSMILTPSARLIRRFCDESIRPSVFVAQFSLTHACFLLTYPLVGAANTYFGFPIAAALMAGVAAAGCVVAFTSWPAQLGQRANVSTAETELTVAQ
ncbi:MFS transporter [Salinibacterium hongtaonis]|uniref:MFS transporter n=1 Tax=Homoserinimonas hongtaonis TaxID=2079791 RepID=UPI000D3C40BB|nr:MFS transporter [Salinibacterium hongtaonis]AWB90041.1 MFS transporter [Salinibacterium hongtaonis]